MAARKEEINTSLPKVGPSQRRFSRLKILFTLLPYCLSLSILSFDFSFSLLLSLILGFPWWLRWLKICLQFRRPEFNPWVGKIPLEEGVAAHSSILSWRIPGTEEPGGLQSIGSQRVGHKPRTLVTLFFFLQNSCFLSVVTWKPLSLFCFFFRTSSYGFS